MQIAKLYQIYVDIQLVTITVFVCIIAYYFPEWVLAFLFALVLSICGFVFTEFLRGCPAGMIPRSQRCVVYRNGKGQIHRTDGPAIIYSDGKQEWYYNGEMIIRDN